MFVVNSDRPNVRFVNYSAELLLCGSAKMTELFSAEHRTFFVLHSMSMAPFHTFVLLNDQHFIIVIGKIAKRMSTEPKLE